MALQSEPAPLITSRLLFAPEFAPRDKLTVAIRPPSVTVTWLRAPLRPTDTLLVLVQTEPAPVIRTVLLVEPTPFPMKESLLTTHPPFVMTSELLL